MLRRIVMAAVGAALALSIGAASAYFTAQVQVPENVIRAGRVSISTEPTSSALSMDALPPGASLTRQLTVVNGGDLPADVVITAAKKAGITAFYNALVCTATAGDVDLYHGPISALSTQPLRMAPSSRVDVRFDVGLPPEADNSLAEAYAKLSLYVDAEQSH